jgi:anti-sigma B factor antagonist
MAEDFVAPLREPPVLGVEAVGDAVVVHLRGELDLHNADEVGAALRQAAEAAPRRLVVDLAEVEFLDSTALGVLIETRSRLARDVLVLARPRFETRRALQVSGLDRHLQVHDSLDAAVAS